MLIYPIDTGGVMDPLTAGILIEGGGRLAYDIYSGERERSEIKSLQKETWKREDTAVQRRVADLQAAGLNPLLAVGSPAATSSPIRPGGRSNLSDGNIFQSALIGQQYKMGQEQIANAKAQNILLTAQAAKTAAEKIKVEESTKYLRELTGTTAAQTKLTLANVGLTQQRIENATLEYLTEQARYNNLSVDSALKVVQRQIAERDFQLLQKLGLMKSPPGGLTGQAGQAVSVIWSVLGHIVSSLAGDTDVSPSIDMP